MFIPRVKDQRKMCRNHGNPQWSSYTHSQSCHRRWADEYQAACLCEMCHGQVRHFPEFISVRRQVTRAEAVGALQYCWKAATACALIDESHPGSVTVCARGRRETEGGREDGCSSRFCPFWKHYSKKAFCLLRQASDGDFLNGRDTWWC